MVSSRLTIPLSVVQPVDAQDYFPTRRQAAQQLAGCRLPGAGRQVCKSVGVRADGVRLHLERLIAVVEGLADGRSSQLGG